jgi:hypothetical protein
VVAASLIWLPVTRRRSARAHLCWATTVLLFVVYLIYAIEWTCHSNLGPFSTVGGLVLALKGQRYRWCFGGIQILRLHWRSMIPGRQNRANHLDAGQRWSYLAGALQWYGDLLGLLFLIFLLAGAFNLATGGGQLFRQLTIFLVAAVPVMVLLGLVRAVALLRRGTGATWRDALGAFFIWQSTSLVVARASVLALFAKKAAFLRTPKTSERTRWWEATPTPTPTPTPSSSASVSSSPSPSVSSSSP